MANTAMGITRVSIANSLKAVPDMGGSSSGISTPSNYQSVNSLRTRLAAISGTTYTSAVLDQMTVNDMVFALRMNDDKQSISNYQP